MADFDQQIAALEERKKEIQTEIDGFKKMKADQLKQSNDAFGKEAEKSK